MQVHSARKAGLIAPHPRRVISTVVGSTQLAAPFLHNDGGGAPSTTAAATLPPWPAQKSLMPVTAGWTLLAIARRRSIVEA